MCEYKEGLNAFCEKTEDCKVANTECSDQNTCVCKSTYVEQNGECKASYGAECAEKEDCAFEKAECQLEVVDETTTTITTSKCRCEDDYVGVNGGCLAKGEGLNIS